MNSDKDKKKSECHYFHKLLSECKKKEINKQEECIKNIKEKHFKIKKDPIDECMLVIYMN